MTCLRCEQDARLYPCGWRCDEHAPRPLNPTPDPELTLDGLRRKAGLPVRVVPTRSSGWAAVDARAIASGKRRSNTADFRAARTEVQAQKGRR